MIPNINRSNGRIVKKMTTRGNDTRREEGLQNSTRDINQSRSSQRSIEGMDRNNYRQGTPTEEELRTERLARKQANMRRRRKRQKKKLFNYAKLGSCCAGIIIFLMVFVFKTPIESGTKLLQEGKYVEAIEKFSDGLSDIDYIAESYKGIGIAYYELGQHKDAIDNLENAIQKGQTSQGTTYYLLAISYMEVGDYENALQNIIIALTKAGNSEELTKELRYNEVLCMEMTSDWEGAKAKATSYMQSYQEDTTMATEYQFLTSR